MIGTQFSKEWQAASEQLHDEAEQAMLSVLLQLQGLRDADCSEYIKGRLAGLEHITRQALEKLQGALGQPGSYLLGRVEFGALVEAVIQERAAALDMKAVVRMQPAAPDVPEDVQRLALRIITQGLEIIALHRIGEVLVQLTQKNAQLFLQIAAIGVGPEEGGFSEPPLSELRAAVEAAGGKLWFAPDGAAGMTLSVILPL